MLAVLILATTVLAGMPVQLGGVVEVLASVCLFTIFYISYRFGFSAGVSWAAISGAIYALRTDDMQMLAAWVFLAVLVNGLTEFLHIGRYGSILIFVASDCLLGYFAFPQMLSEAGIKAIATAVFVLFFYRDACSCKCVRRGMPWHFPGQNGASLRFPACAASRMR